METRPCLKFIGVLLSTIVEYYVAIKSCVLDSIIKNNFKIIKISYELKRTVKVFLMTKS